MFPMAPMNNPVLALVQAMQQGRNPMALMQAMAQQNPQVAQAGFNALGAQLAQCCCDNRAAVADLKYDLSTQFCGLGNAIQMQTRDIIDNQNANYRGIMDFLVTEKLSAKDAQIAQLQNQVSQANQNAVIRAAIDASTAEIIRRTGNDCPTPAYWVNPPTPVQAPCSWTNGGYNGGCGCGC